MSQIATFSDVAKIAGVTIIGSYQDNKCIKYSDILPNNRSAFWVPDIEIKNISGSNLMACGIDNATAMSFMQKFVPEVGSSNMSEYYFVPDMSLNLSGETMYTMPFWFRKTSNSSYDVGLISAACYQMVGEFVYADFSPLQEIIYEQPTEAACYLEGSKNSVYFVLPFLYCTVIPQYENLSGDPIWDTEWTIDGKAAEVLIKIQLL